MQPDEPVSGFTPGDKVWPAEGPMVLQAAPQTVIATYRHPVAGDWLWLDDGRCGFRSWAAAYWTTEEPDEAEKAARKERMRGVGEFADYIGRTLTFCPSPILPVPVDEALPGADMPPPRRRDYPLTGPPLGFPPPMLRDEDAPPGHKAMWRQDDTCPLPWACTTCPEVHCDPSSRPCTCCRTRADAESGGTQ